jgi:hypothetical protein
MSMAAEDGGSGPLTGATITWSGRDNATLRLRNGRRFVLDRATGHACAYMLQNPVASPEQLRSALDAEHGIQASPDRLRRLRRLVDTLGAPSAPPVQLDDGVTLLTLDRERLPLARTGGVALVAAALAGLVCLVFTVHRQRWRLELPVVVSWQTWVVFALTLVANRLGHELGHCVAGLRLGARRACVRLRWRRLLPFVVSRLDALDDLSRRSRLLVTGAGFAGQALVVLTLLPLLLTPVAAVRQGVMLAAVEALVFSMPVNLSPLGNTDGYFLLVDGLGEPRLRSLAAEWLRGLPTRRPRPVRVTGPVVAFLLAVAAYMAVLATAYGSFLTRLLGPIGAVVTAMVLVVALWSFRRPRERVWRL